jgi:hypothetical protein
MVQPNTRGRPAAGEAARCKSRRSVSPHPFKRVPLADGANVGENRKTEKRESLALPIRVGRGTRGRAARLGEEGDGDVAPAGREEVRATPGASPCGAGVMRSRKIGEKTKSKIHVTPAVCARVLDMGPGLPCRSDRWACCSRRSMKSGSPYGSPAYLAAGYASAST